MAIVKQAMTFDEALILDLGTHFLQCLQLDVAYCWSHLFGQQHKSMWVKETEQPDEEGRLSVRDCSVVPRADTNVHQYALLYSINDGILCDNTCNNTYLWSIFIYHYLFDSI